MNILGVNAFHDGSAALVVNGKLIAAVKEERFNHRKHWAGFPEQSIAYVIERGGLSLQEIDHVAISADPQTNYRRTRLPGLWNRRPLNAIEHRSTLHQSSTLLKSLLTDACGTDALDFDSTIHHVEHHNAQIACGYMPSPFVHAAILSLGGMGDFVSTLLAAGNGEVVKNHREANFPHSLGYLHKALMAYLGFSPHEDEALVMELAACGNPRFLGELRHLVFPNRDTFQLNLKYFSHVKNGIDLTCASGSRTIEAYHSNLLEGLLGPARKPEEEVTNRHEDIAASLQRVTEEIIFHMLRRLHHITAEKNLVMIDGCALNSVIHDKITRETPFENVHVPGGVAGNVAAIGAAFHVWNRVLGRRRRFRLEQGFQGSNCETAGRHNEIQAHPAHASGILTHVTALVQGNAVVPNS